MKKIAYKLILLLRNEKLMDALLGENMNKYIYFQDTDEWMRLYCDDSGMRSAILTEESLIEDGLKSNAYIFRNDVLLNHKKEEFSCFYRYVDSYKECLYFAALEYRIEYVNNDFKLREKFIYSIEFKMDTFQMTYIFNDCYNNLCDFLKNHESDFLRIHPNIGYRTSTQTTTQLYHETMRILEKQKKSLVKLNFFKYIKGKEGRFINRLYGNDYLFDTLLYYLIIAIKLPNKTAIERKANMQLAETVLDTSVYKSFADFAETRLNLD